MPEELLILKFDTVQEAVEFAKEIDPKSIAYEVMFDIDQDNEVWLLVLGICDICNQKDMFFIPAIAFEDGIEGCECINCGNKSVYPKEGSFSNA